MAGATGIGLVLTSGGTPVADVYNIGGPSMSRNAIDNTTFDNIDGFRSYFTGLRDGGTLTFDIIFTKAGYTAILADFNDDDPVAYVLAMPASPDVPATLFVLDDGVGFSLTSKIAGTPGNAYSLEIVEGAVSAGAETVVVVGGKITVTIEADTSTIAQVVAALGAETDVTDIVTVTPVGLQTGAMWALADTHLAVAAIISFDGLVTDMPLTIPLDDKITVSITIKVVGAVNIAP